MRKIVIAVALAATTAVAIPVIAQQPTTQPGAKDPSRVKAGTYTVDSAHTQVLWEVNHLGFNDYFGLFGDAKGKLTIDPAKPSAASVEIEIPINSVATSSAGLTKHLLGTDFFDAAKFPTATFKSTSVVVDGNDAKITGDLTIKGVTKQVVLDAEFQGAGLFAMTKKDTVGFEAETKIKRSDFGVSYGIPMVPDVVELKISVAFEKPAA
ncbi:polyisoprenoid-binding protein [Sphingomonas sp. DBB INV C78]|uniref:YceI family protein n=1 Tax=Sphingomonas sp. DBB INV C78 TaxID=3349434 RepID=UPI0036D3FF82